MPPLHLATLVALTLASADAPDGAPLALGVPPADELVMAALPPPPDRVFLETRTYGTVTVNHRAHLERRIACKSCHLTSRRVGPIAFTPKLAHESCRACHVTASRGPTECRDCHNRSPEPPAVAPDENVRFVFRGPDGKRTSAATTSRPPPPPPKVESAVAAAGAAPAAALAASSAPPDAGRAAFGGAELEPGGLSFQRATDLAFAMARPGSGVSLGPAVRLTLRSDWAVFAESLEWTSGRSGRVTGLLGGGVVLPLGRRVDLQLLAYGGFDVWYRPAVALKPAVSAGAELQWHRASFPRMLGVAVSATSDIGSTHDTYGDRTGGFTSTVALVARFSRAE